MKKLVIGILIGFLLATGTVFAYETIVDLGEDSVPLINDILKQMQNELRNLDVRVTALEP